MKELSILSVKKIGEEQTYNLRMNSRFHNYILSNGVVSANSHSAAYGILGYKTQWLKCHYPFEFYAAMMMIKDDQEELIDLRKECITRGFTFELLDINKSGYNFRIEDNSIRWGFKAIKGIGEKICKFIEESQPYSDFDDFITKMSGKRLTSKVCSLLIASGCFNKIEKQSESKLLEYYYSNYRKKNEEIPQEYRDMDLEIDKIKTNIYGFTLSNELEEIKLKFKEELIGYKDAKNFHNVKEGAKTGVLGTVSRLRAFKDRNGRFMAFMTLEDPSGNVEVVWFGGTHNGNVPFVDVSEMVNQGITIGVYGTKNESKIVGVLAAVLFKRDRVISHGSMETQQKKRCSRWKR